MKTAIIMATMNRGDLILQSIESVCKQTDSDWELVIVDDRSTDNTARKVRRYMRYWPRAKWQYLMQEPNDGSITAENTGNFIDYGNGNRGQVAASNLGIQSSQSEYIMQLDSDDLLDPTYLEETTAPLNSGEADIVACNIQFFGAMTHVWDMSRTGWSADAMYTTNVIPACSIYRRALYDVVGGYEPRYIFNDWFFWVKCMFAGARLRRIPSSLYRSRQGYGDQRSDTVNMDTGRRQIQVYIDTRLRGITVGT